MHTQLSVREAPGYAASFGVVSAFWSVKVRKIKKKRKKENQQCTLIIDVAVLEQDHSWSPSSSEHRGAPGWALQGGEIKKLAPKHLGWGRNPGNVGYKPREDSSTGCLPLSPLQTCIPHSWCRTSSKKGFKHMFKYWISNTIRLWTKDSDVKQISYPKTSHTIWAIKSLFSTWTQTGILLSYPWLTG